MRRRTFVESTLGATLVAGCLTRDGGEPAETGDEDQNEQQPDGSGESDESDGGEISGGEIPADVETILDALPAEVDGDPLTQFKLFALKQDPKVASPVPRDDFTTSEGLTPAELSYGAVADFGDGSRWVRILVGSFTAEDVDEASLGAMHVEDGFVVSGSENLGLWESGVQAVLRTRERSDAGISSPELTTLIAPVVENELITVVRRPPQSELAIADTFERWAVGIRAVDDRRIAVSSLFQLAGDVSNRALATELLGAYVDTEDESEIEFTSDGELLLAEMTQRAPHRYFPDNSPDAQFDIGDGVVEHSGEEPVDPAHLEFRIDGEPRPPPWGDRSEPIEPEDKFEFEAGPFKPVRVMWLDPNLSGVTQLLGQGVVVEDGVFTSEFDRTASGYVIDYDGERALDADRFRVKVSELQEFGIEKTPLTEFVGETLDPGEQFTVEEASAEERVSIIYELEKQSLSTSIHVYVADQRNDRIRSTDSRT